MSFFDASKPAPRRFIAGAVCPKCAEQDKTVMYRISETEQKRECVRCGYNEVISDQPDAEEIATRVNQPKPGEPVLAHEEPISVVTILDPKDNA